MKKDYAMNIEDKKQVASQAYALERLGDVENIFDLQNAWLAGYEAATPKWNKIKNGLPEEDVPVLCYVINRYIPEVNKYSVCRYYEGHWYGELEEHERVEE